MAYRSLPRGTILRWKTIATDAATASIRAISYFNRLFTQGKSTLLFGLSHDGLIQIKDSTTRWLKSHYL